MRLQLKAGVCVFIPPKAHRLLPNLLDNLEDCLTLLRPYGVTEEASEKSNVLPERLVLVANLKRPLDHNYASLL